MKMLLTGVCILPISVVLVSATYLFDNDSAQKTPIPLNRLVSTITETMCLSSVRHQGFQSALSIANVQLLENLFRVFSAFYRGHFFHDVHLKEKVPLDRTRLWPQRVYFRVIQLYRYLTRLVL